MKIQLLKLFSPSDQKDLCLLAPANESDCCHIPSAVDSSAARHQAAGIFDKYSHICFRFSVLHFMGHFASFVPVPNSLYFFTENYIRQLIEPYSIVPKYSDTYEYNHFCW